MNKYITTEVVFAEQMTDKNLPKNVIWDEFWTCHLIVCENPDGSKVIENGDWAIYDSSETPIAVLSNEDFIKKYKKEEIY